LEIRRVIARIHAKELGECYAPTYMSNIIMVCEVKSRRNDKARALKRVQTSAKAAVTLTLT